MARLKTGALIGCAMQLGASIATDDNVVIDAFAESGRKLGTAFQVHDDINDTWSVETEMLCMPPGDILSKKKTLPLVYALQKADVRKKRELGTMYLKRVLDPEDVPRVLTVLDEVGAKEYAQSMVRDLWKQTLVMLEGVLTEGSDIDELKQVAEFYIFSSK